MKKNWILWILALSFPIQVFSQNSVSQKFAREINAVDARKHLTILASDEFEGRETGQPGAEKAANYIADEFKKLGLLAPVDGSYFQEIPLIKNLIEVKSLTVNGFQLSQGKDFYFSGNPTSTALKSNQLVFIGYGIDSESYSDLANTDITGKIVLVINKGEPIKNEISAITKTTELSKWSTDRYKRIEYIRSKNPALILAVSPETGSFLEKNQNYFNQKNDRLFIKGAIEKAITSPKSSPIINISPVVADLFLKNSGESYQALKNSIDSTSTPRTQTLKADINADFGTISKDVKAVNVLGYLKGTDLKDEVLIFSSHYDHIGLTSEGTDKVNNGADDDGSGTTAVLEIAKAFVKAKQQGNGPRRSILFLTFSGEEKGLLGSEWYSNNPVFPLKKTITNLNTDMIGRIGEEYLNEPDSVNYIYVIGSGKLSSGLRKISENANKVYTKMTLDYKYDDPNDSNRFYYRSDHYNFAKHGIPIIFYFNGVHEDYHKPGDEVSKINFDLLTKRAQLAFYTGWDLANRNKRPVVDVKNDMPSNR